jgi:hypothetical protein
MRALLDHLSQYVRTLTVYGFAGSEKQLAELAGWLDGYGVHLQTVETDGSGPGNVAVLHRDSEVLGACTVEALLARADIGAEIDDDREPALDILSQFPAEVVVKRGLSVTEMVRVSREYERRALREGAGTLHAGFQQLSQIAGSEQTMETYAALVDAGVGVYVYGYPDTGLENPPFTVVEDRQRDLERYWFLLYDGGGNPRRTAALVSEECLTDETGGDADGAPGGSGGSYDSYFTTAPEVVADLFDLADEEHGDLLRLSA